MLVRHLPGCPYTHEICLTSCKFPIRIEQVINLTPNNHLLCFIYLKRLFFFNDNFKVSSHLLTSCDIHVVMFDCTISDYLILIVILIITSYLIQKFYPYFAWRRLNHPQKVIHLYCYDFGRLSHAMSRGLVKWLFLLIDTLKIKRVLLVI